MGKQQEEGKKKDEVSARTELDRQIRGKRGIKEKEAKQVIEGESPPSQQQSGPLVPRLQTTDCQRERLGPLFSFRCTDTKPLWR